jgi:hypothetical protein
MLATTTNTIETASISGVEIPDSKLAREITELVRDTESPLLFNHSTRVYYFSSLAGKRRGIKIRPRAALRECDVSRYGFDSAI